MFANYMQAYQSTMKHYMGDIANVRALILYLGLPPEPKMLEEPEDHPHHRWEKTRLRMRADFGSGRQDNVFAETLTSSEKSRYKWMEESSLVGSLYSMDGDGHQCRQSISTSWSLHRIAPYRC